MFLSRRKAVMPTPDTALPGRSTPLATAEEHYVLSRPLKPPYPAQCEVVYFGLGCFWGAERAFWNLGPGIWITAVGYQGGYSANPTYEEVCSGGTGHTEIVKVVYDPTILSFDALLKAFWESHDPTQGNRQGNDVGTQYRSAIFTTTPAQLAAAKASRDRYASELKRSGYGEITTEVAPAPEFYYAEDYHQQYLAKVPGGYCGLGGTGVSCPAPVKLAAKAGE